MSEYRYPRQALTGDYVRAGAGLLLTGGPLLAVDVGFWPQLLLGALVILFGFFGWRTWVRQMTTVVVGEDGISTLGPRRASLPWSELRRVKLSYFSTRRDKSGGWMQLNLKGGGRNLQFDSNLEGFDDIARRTFEAAMAYNVELSATTIGNFAGLGLTPGKADASSWGDPKQWQGDSGPGDRGPGDRGPGDAA